MSRKTRELKVLGISRPIATNQMHPHFIHTQAFIDAVFPRQYLGEDLTTRFRTRNTQSALNGKVARGRRPYKIEEQKRAIGFFLSLADKLRKARAKGEAYYPEEIWPIAITSRLYPEIEPHKKVHMRHIKLAWDKAIREGSFELNEDEWELWELTYSSLITELTAFSASMARREPKLKAYRKKYIQKLEEGWTLKEIIADIDAEYRNQIQNKS